MPGPTSLSPTLTQRVTVGVGDMAVANSGHVMVSTYALGSCIGVIAFDGQAMAGGILHLMLPSSDTSAEKAALQPAMFADTGLPLFLRALAGLKATRANLRFMVAGGARVLSGNDPFQIGERNTVATMAYLRRQACTLLHEETGGNFNRTLHLEMSSGLVTLKSPNGTSMHFLGT